MFDKVQNIPRFQSYLCLLYQTFDPFQANIMFLYLLKTPKNITFWQDQYIAIY